MRKERIHLEKHAIRPNSIMSIYWFSKIVVYFQGCLFSGAV